MTLLDSLTRSLDRILALRDNAVPLARAQVAHLDEPAALALFRWLIARDPALYFTADTLAPWPARVREAAIAHVLAMPSGRSRIEAMLALERFLPEGCRDEALDGILDGTAPEFETLSMPVSYASFHEAFVKTLCAQQKERWLATADRDEIRSRNAIEYWPPEAITRCWNELKQSTTSGRALPSEAISIYRVLPPALRAEALSILRARATQDERRYAFCYFERDDLTDEEREDTVATPWNVYTRSTDRAFADHLCHVKHLFASVSAALRAQTLERALALPVAYDRHCALAHIVRVVDERDRARVVQELARLTVDEAFWPTSEERYDFFDTQTLASLVANPALQKTRWLLASFITEALSRDEASQDTVFAAALDNAIAAALDEQPEPLCAMSPWLAARSNGEIPRWIASRFIA
ncbi:MAG: hypothetical protein JNK05_13670 [Myxococcales bacterium]|nr:hypothetical protein [Myxococcales bacterium]